MVQKSCLKSLCEYRQRENAKTTGMRGKRATTRRRLEFFGRQGKKKRIHVCPSAQAWYVVFVSVCEKERDWCESWYESADEREGKRIFFSLSSWTHLFGGEAIR